MPNIPILIENTNQIIDFIEGLPLLQDEGLMIMLNQLRQLNVIAHQIQELNLLGNNLGYFIRYFRFRMGHIFANRIQELQTTIINQIGVTLVRGFHN